MRFPISMKECLARGWKIEGSESFTSADEVIERGVMLLRNPSLPGVTLRVPFTAARSFGKPVACGELMTLESYERHMERLRRDLYRQLPA